MRPTDKIKQHIKNTKIKTNPTVNNAVLNDLLDRLDTVGETRQTASPNRWRIIMHSKMTKQLAAAITVIAGILSLTLVNNIIPSAYAIQDTIKAYNSVRWLHVKEFTRVGKEIRPSEFWVECEDSGEPGKFRFQTPNAGTIGSITAANDGSGTVAWLPKFNLCYKTSGLPYYDAILLLQWDISEIDPKMICKNLYEQQELGQVILDIEEPAQKSEPIVVTVTYPAESLSAGCKKVLYIDQATKLLIKSEFYHCFPDGEDQHVRTAEFFDYNQEIDPAMFSLEHELPENVIRADQSDKEIGLVQGDMTDEEIAEELTRQFFEALVAEDFSKAGLLYCGVPGFVVEQEIMGAKILEITSIGPAHRETTPGSNAMVSSCKGLIDFAGQIYELDANMVRLRPVASQPRRWVLSGTNISVKPASGSLSLSQDQPDLSAVNYDGLVPGEFMQKWLLLEPMMIEVRGDTLFPSDQTQKIEFDTDQIDAAQFKPTVMIGEKEYQWLLLQNDYGTINLTSVNENWYLITYARAQINMPEEKQAVLGIGSDDSVKVWLNGELVHENYTSRGVGIDNDRIPVTFKKGTNQLVLKIQNGGGPWGFCCRLLDE